MNKRLKLILVIMTLVSIIYLCTREVGIVKVQNNTEEPITDIRLIYTNTNEVINIDYLEHGEYFEHKLKTDIEQSLVVEFKGSNGMQYSKTVVGYIYKGSDTEFIKKKKIKLSDERVVTKKIIISEGENGEIKFLELEGEKKIQLN